MMDLMYGCGSDYDYSEEELPEVDLKAEHDRIIAVTTGKAIDLMTELATSPLFEDNDEYDELEVRFDSSPRFDPYTISSSSPNKSGGVKCNNSTTTKLKTLTNSHRPPQHPVNGKCNGNNSSSQPILISHSNSKIITVNNNHLHHNNNNSNGNNITNNSSSPLNNNSTSKNHSQIIRLPHQQAQNHQTLLSQQQQQIKKFSAKCVNSVTSKTLNNTSGNNSISSSTTTTTTFNGISNNNSSNVHKPSIAQNTVSSLSALGGLAALEETVGALVEPASVVPVSVSNSVSSTPGSDGEYQELATDEDESECELNSNTVWVLPRRTSSRSPSPNDIPEFEFDEPEFIITNGTTIQEIPPPKKRKQKHEPQPHTDGKIYPKPAFSYSCLIAMSLKNSKTGSLPVSEIYKFMCDHFPYFKSAPSGWKNSVRHNLSLNKCFEKIEKPGNGTRKGCLWALNPAKIHKMDEEVQKWSRKDPLAIRRAMSDPENLELIEKGELKRDYSGNGASDEDEEDDLSEPCTPLTQAQLLARRSRGNSSDSLPDQTTISSTTPTTTVSQVHSISLNRPIEQKIHVKKSEAMDTLPMDFATITNVQGNYLCHTGAGNGTYTLSFSALSNATTPIIIRRTPVK